MNTQLSQAIVRDREMIAKRLRRSADVRGANLVQSITPMDRHAIAGPTGRIDLARSANLHAKT